MSSKTSAPLWGEPWGSTAVTPCGSLKTSQLPRAQPPHLGGKGKKKNHEAIWKSVACGESPGQAGVFYLSETSAKDHGNNLVEPTVNLQLGPEARVSC